MDMIRSEPPLPPEYGRPMAEMIHRFAESVLGPPEPASPAAVAVAIAVVIVLWENEQPITPEQRTAIRFALDRIQANPDLVMRATGIELSNVHLKLMRALAEAPPAVSPTSSAGT